MSADPAKPWGTIVLHNNLQRGLENSFLSYMQTVPPLSGENLLEAIREDMGAMKLVNPDIVSNYEIYKRIRVFLEQREIDVPQTADTGRLIAKRVITAIWNGEEFAVQRKRAMDYLDALRSGDVILYSPGGSSSPSAAQIPFQLQVPQPINADRGPAAPNVGVADEEYENKRVTFFTSRYRGKSDKFKGDLEKDWNDHDSSFMDYCNLKKINGDLRIQYLHFSLAGDALHFFKGEVKGLIQNWGAVVAVFNARYASETTREDIFAKLEDLHLTDLVTDNVSELEALDLLVKEFVRVAPMAHQEDRTDRRKRNFFRSAVQGISWSQNILSQVNAKHLSDRDLMSELFSAERNQRQFTAGQNPSQPAQKTQRASSDDIPFRPSLSNANVVKGPPDYDPSVHFAGQGRFARPPTSRSTFKPPRFESRLYNPRRAQPQHKDVPMILKVCWNCQQKDCRLFTCLKPRNEARIHRNKQLAKQWYKQSRSKRINFTELDDDASAVVEQFTESLLVEYHSPDPEQTLIAEAVINQDTANADSSAACISNALPSQELQTPTTWPLLHVNDIPCSSDEGF